MTRFAALAGAAALALGTTAAVAAAAASTANGPTDPQIAHIAYTAGAIDVAAGQQALAKSHNKAVRAFAEEMVRDHKAVNDQALALVKKLHVTPADNPTSNALKSTLIPSADNAELKSLLETGLTLFTEHQNHAEHLAASLK
jgi:putative membrane protein